MERLTHINADNLLSVKDSNYALALRKLAEYEDEEEYRENGCKYCTEYEDLPEHFVDGRFVGKVFDTSIGDDENGWHIELPGSYDIGIKFCPFCGREL